MSRKCRVCNSCMDDAWIQVNKEPKQMLHFLYCWLCDTYYEYKSGILKALTKEEFNDIIGTN